MRGISASINDEPIKDYQLQAKIFSPDIVIRQAGLYTIVNATDFMIRWDGGILIN